MDIDWFANAHAHKHHKHAHTTFSILSSARQENYIQLKIHWQLASCVYCKNDGRCVSFIVNDGTIWQFESTGLKNRATDCQLSSSVCIFICQIVVAIVAVAATVKYRPHIHIYTTALARCISPMAGYVVQIIYSFEISPIAQSPLQNYWLSAIKPFLISWPNWICSVHSIHSFNSFDVRGDWYVSETCM